ncbi:hypothetical protein ABZ820_15710 [Streptomyces diacarni]|uniref:hypothetical protein n=1 Tax=Streptomyces diacarni TaxID=2800381 RepID=UPI0033EE96B1
MPKAASLRSRTLPADHFRRAQPAEDDAYGFAEAPLSWVATSGGSVADTLLAWERGEVAELITGCGWDVVSVPARVGWEAARYLGRMHVPVGPVLSTVHDVRWLVLTGTAHGWDLGVGRLLPVGSAITVPHPAITAPHTVRGHSWIVEPRNRLTDGADLYGACVAYSAGRAMRLGPAS